MPLPPLNMAGYTASLNWPRTPPHAYPQTAAVWADGGDHYDVPRCMQKVIDYTGDSAGWASYLATSIRYLRDQVYLAGGGVVQGYHAYSEGMLRNYELTGDPLSRNAAILVALNASYQSDIQNLSIMVPVDFSRELAFSILNRLDLLRLGATTVNLSLLANRVAIAKNHIVQWIAPPPRPWATFMRPFMLGLTLEALTAYYDRFRDSTIPPLIKQGLDWNWTNMWVGASEAFRYTDVDTATHFVPIPCVVADVSPSTLAFKATVFGGAAISPNDDYATHAMLVFTSGANDGRQVRVTGYVGATGQMLFGARGMYPGSPGTLPVAPANGDTFLITSGGAVTGFSSGNTDPTSALNLMITPFYAWYYRYSGDSSYLTKHDQAFTGSMASKQTIFSQKEWNQQVRTSTDGLSWREQGDTPWPAAASYTFTGPPATTIKAGQLSGLFHVGLAGDVSVAAPVKVTPSDGGSGVFLPPFQLLTTDRPDATFRYRSLISDLGTKNIGIGNDGGLMDPLPVPIMLSGTATVATGVSVSVPASQGYLSDPPVPVTFALDPPGSDTAPASADVYAAMADMDPTDGGLGEFAVLTENPIGYRVSYFPLAGDTPSVTLNYTPRSAGLKPLRAIGYGVPTSSIFNYLVLDSLVAPPGGSPMPLLVRARRRMVVEEPIPPVPDYPYGGHFFPVLLRSMRRNVFAPPVPDPGVYIGRYVRGQEVLATLLPGEDPDEIPVVALATYPAGAGFVTYELPLVANDPQTFELPIFLGANFDLGTFRLTYSYLVSGIVHTQIETFDVIEGGDSGGQVFSIFVHELPGASYLIAQTRSGRLFQGRNPSL